MFSETTSGAKLKRVQLRCAIKALGEGDVLVVTRLDRLAPSTHDRLNLLQEVSDRRASFLSLNDAWANTTTAHGRLMPTVLSGLVELVRELMHKRISEGRVRAKAQGAQLGRPHKLSVNQRRFVADERAKGEDPRQLAKILGVSRATIARVPTSGS